jgi:hypothetical protein
MSLDPDNRDRGEVSQPVLERQQISKTSTANAPASDGRRVSLRAMFVHVSSALNLIVLMCAVLVLAANIGPTRPVGVRTAVELLERKRIQNTFAPARMVGYSSAHSADRLRMAVPTSAYGRLPRCAPTRGSRRPSYLINETKQFSFPPLT